MICTTPVRSLKATPEGSFEGLAWSFASTPDQQGDVILPSAFASISSDLPVLVEHQGPAVGRISETAVDATGLIVKGTFDLGEATARQAFERVRSGELHGLSIAFTGEGEKSGPVRVFRSAQLAEISVCRAPVNLGSRVTAAKAMPHLGSAAELERFLVDAGMPRRLALKTAAAAWPAVFLKSETDPALVEALRRFANF